MTKSTGARALATKPGDAEPDYCPDAGDLIWIDLRSVTNRATVRGYPFEVALPEGAAISGVVLADQPRSVSWQKRDVRYVGGAPAALLDDVRERLYALLGDG